MGNFLDLNEYVFAQQSKPRHASIIIEGSSCHLHTHINLYQILPRRSLERNSRSVPEFGGNLSGALVIPKKRPTLAGTTWFDAGIKGEISRIVKVFRKLFPQNNLLGKCRGVFCTFVCATQWLSHNFGAVISKVFAVPHGSARTRKLPISNLL